MDTLVSLRFLFVCWYNKAIQKCSRPVRSIGSALDSDSGDPGSIPRTAQVTFVVIEREIFSMVICTVPLLWYLQKFQFLAKLKATSTCKLLDSLPRNNAVAELCLVNSMWLTGVIRSENYHDHHVCDIVLQFCFWQTHFDSYTF
jgi:hypothetical protein